MDLRRIYGAWPYTWQKGGSPNLPVRGGGYGEFSRNSVPSHVKTILWRRQLLLDAGLKKSRSAPAPAEDMKNELKEEVKKEVTPVVKPEVDEEMKEEPLP